MNLTRAILEGIHEVELEITPEFQKPGGPGAAKGGAAPGWDWAEPETRSWGKTPRIDYEWPDGTVIRGVKAKAHGNAYAISWPGSSSSLIGHWGGAVRAIVKKDPWNRIYVYDVPESHMPEFDELNLQGVVWATYYPNNADSDPTYDANVADMLKEYVVPPHEPGLEPELGEEYLVLYKTSAIKGLIGDRPWVSHTYDIISKDYPVAVQVPPGDLEAIESVRSVLDASGLTYEHSVDVPVFRVFGSSGMTESQIHKAFTKLLPDLDTVLGGPEP